MVPTTFKITLILPLILQSICRVNAIGEHVKRRLRGATRGERLPAVTYIKTLQVTMNGSQGAEEEFEVWNTDDDESNDNYVKSFRSVDDGDDDKNEDDDDEPVDEMNLTPQRSRQRALRREQTK